MSTLQPFSTQASNLVVARGRPYIATLQTCSAQASKRKESNHAAAAWRSVKPFIKHPCYWKARSFSVHIHISEIYTKYTYPGEAKEEHHNHVPQISNFQTFFQITHPFGNISSGALCSELWARLRNQLFFPSWAAPRQILRSKRHFVYNTSFEGHLICCCVFKVLSQVSRNNVSFFNSRCATGFGKQRQKLLCNKFFGPHFI